VSWRKRLAELIAGQKIENSTPWGATLANSSTWGEWLEFQGKLAPLSERSALTVSAIYACVNLIAGAISALPLNIYRISQVDGERQRLYNDDLWWMLNEQMGQRWSAAIGWEYLIQSLLLGGDAFAIIHRDRDGRPTGLEPVHWQNVAVYIWPSRDRVTYQITAIDNVTPMKVYDQDDVIHVPGFAFDGSRGLSPLRYALRMSGSSAMATQEYAGNFFANSARPDYALVTTQHLGKDTIDDLREKVRQKHQGTDNSHLPMVLHGGLDIKPIMMRHDEMQLLELRQFQVEEIARIYGVPPFMIGHNDKTTSWGSGVESMGIGFVRYTLRQLLHKIENELNRKLIRQSGKVIEFDTTELERADTKSLFESLRIAVGRAGEPKLMSVNEARQVLRLKKVEGGDDMEAEGNEPTPEPVSQ
jgi:HK97 family phage portal protein